MITFSVELDQSLSYTTPSTYPYYVTLDSPWYSKPVTLLPHSLGKSLYLVIDKESNLQNKPYLLKE